MSKRIKDLKRIQRLNKMKAVCEKYSINNAVKFLKQDFGLTKSEARAFYSSVHN